MATKRVRSLTELSSEQFSKRLAVEGRKYPIGNSIIIDGTTYIICSPPSPVKFGGRGMPDTWEKQYLLTLGRKRKYYFENTKCITCGTVAEPMFEAQGYDKLYTCECHVAWVSHYYRVCGERPQILFPVG